MLTFRVEPYSKCIDEMQRLMPEHYAEVATEQIPLDIAFDQYLMLESLNMLHVVTGRLDGVMNAYYTSIVMPHIQHRQSLTAFPDMLYLKHEHRNGFTLMRLFKTVEETLAARGVNRMFTGVVLTHDFGTLLEKMGFKPIERMYSKMLG